MRIFMVIAAVLACATSAQADEPRHLLMAGVDERIPAALGRAAEAPKMVEPPEPAAAAKPADEPKADQPPAYVARPSAIGTKSAVGKSGRTTAEDDKSVAAKPAAVETGRRTARADKPRRKHAQPYWSEARIRRELARYGIYW